MEPQRDVADVRALLMAHGPAILFQAIEAACAELARDDDDLSAAAALLWGRAAHAAGQATASFLVQGEEEGGEGDAEEGDPPLDDDDEEEDDEGDAEEEDDAEVCLAGSEGASDGDDRSSEQPQEDTTMAKEDELGQRPSMAMNWGLQFRPSKTDKWVSETRRENDRYDTAEWPIKTCSLQAIIRDWPHLTGEVRVKYLKKADPNDRTPRVCGYSHSIPVRAVRSSIDVDAARGDRAPAASASSPMDGLAAMARGVAPIVPAQNNSSPTFGEMMSMLAMLRQDAKQEIEARERVQLERERLASQERIAQIEANGRIRGGGGGAASFDPDALAERIGERVGARVQQALEAIRDADDEEEEEETPSVPAPTVPAVSPTDTINALATALAPYLQPLMPTILQALKGPGLPSVPLPPSIAPANEQDASHAAE